MTAKRGEETSAALRLEGWVGFGSALDLRVMMTWLSVTGSWENKAPS